VLLAITAPGTWKGGPPIATLDTGEMANLLLYQKLNLDPSVIQPIAKHLIFMVTVLLQKKRK
jgi:hypothetical protein